MEKLTVVVKTILLALFMLEFSHASPQLLQPTIVRPKSMNLLRNSGKSSLFSVELPENTYPTTPFLIELVGTRTQIGYDYASLLHNETINAFTTFMNSMYSPEEQVKLMSFVDWCWDKFLMPHTPQFFLDELDGMRSFATYGDAVANISLRFYTLANMPADKPNIIGIYILIKLFANK